MHTASAIHGAKKLALILFGAGLLIAFAADRLSKDWAIINVPLHQTRPGLGTLYNFYLTHNTGAAFSVGKDNSSLVLTIASVATVALVWWSLKNIGQIPAQPLKRFGAGLIVGASLGNLFDRMIQGYVTDFIQFGFMDFPVFNIADALIDVGVVLLFVQLLFLPKAACRPACRVR